jgi:hypothetical protein
MVRQGGSMTIDLPNTTDADIHLVSSADLMARVVWQPPKPASIEVTAPHATPLGAGVKEFPERQIRFYTTSGGVKVDRAIPIIVSPIAATLAGNDKADGTTDHPFRTFAKAAEFVGDGDTIELKNDSNGELADGDHPAPVTLPPNVTVRSQTDQKVKFNTKLILQGTATFNNIYFISERLVVDQPGTQVTLTSCYTVGIEVTENAVGTELLINGPASELRADGDQHGDQHQALLVSGNGSKVRLEQGTHVLGGVMLPAIHFRGQGQNLTIADGAYIDGSKASPVLLIEGRASVSITNPEVVYGRFDFTNPGITAALTGGIFRMGQGQGGIYFKGKELTLQGAQFVGCNGVEQENPASKVIVRNTQFTDYPKFAYHLLAGVADLGDGENKGSNEFHLTSPMDADAPIALINDARGMMDGVMTNSLMTVSDATYNFVVPLPQLPCTMTGELKQAPLYKLCDTALLNFY